MIFIKRLLTIVVPECIPRAQGIMCISFVQLKTNYRKPLYDDPFKKRKGYEAPCVELHYTRGESVRYCPTRITTRMRLG